VSRIVITPPGRWSLPAVRELWEAREVLYQFGQRDIVLRYRQTVVGVAWVLLQPLAAAGIFSIVFGQVANMPSSGLPYFVFGYIGMLAWSLFNNIIARGSVSLVSNQALISKVFFPRILVPLSSVLAVLLDYLVALALAAVLLVVFEIHPGWPVLLLPVWTALLILLAAGIALIMSSVMVTYRDVAYVLPWLLQILLYAAPVAYALEAVPDHLRLFYDLNPLTWYLEAYRYSLLGLSPPAWWQVVGAGVVGIGTFLLGAIVFQRFERGFADVI
jgi:lipopolysaccharide transport system permease protein